MTVSTDEKPAPLRKRLLGQILLERGTITQNQLNHALQIQEKQGGLLGEILVELDYIKEQDIVVALVVQCHVPYIAIDQYDIDQSLVDLIPQKIAQKYRVMPLEKVNRILSVVMADPLDMEAKTELQNLTNCRLVPFIATYREIEKAIHRCYSN